MSSIAAARDCSFCTGPNYLQEEGMLPESKFARLSDQLVTTTSILTIATECGVGPVNSLVFLGFW